MIKVEGVSAGYGKLGILNDVSLQAEPSKITVVVGPNGSGKSTLLKTIAGLTNVYQGRILLKDEEITRLPPHEIARRGLAYLPQTESVFTQLTVSENIRMAAYTVKSSQFQGRMEGVLRLFPQIANYTGTKVQNLSGGERQMVAMAMAMLREPSVVMFDEPTANLSPKIANQVLKIIESLARDLKLTVVLVEQNAKRALEIGDSAILMVGGHPAFAGGAQELLKHQELARLYLGLKTS